MKHTLNQLPQLLIKALGLMSILWMGYCSSCKKPIVSKSDYPNSNNSEPTKPIRAKEVVVFFGNPGSGKSSLLNSIVQKVAFSSGINVGAGKTKTKKEFIDQNIKYIDTPGLSDLLAKNQAALEIEKALKENNNYKIVFVATCESARIRSDDLVTINTICEAIKTDFEYGLIINKVTKKALQKLKDNQEELLNIYAETLKKLPVDYLFIELEEELNDEEDVYLAANSQNRTNLLKFIKNLPAKKIAETQVESLDVRSFDERLKEMEVKMQREFKERLNKAERSKKRNSK